MATLVWTGTTDGDFSKKENFIDFTTGVTPDDPPANSDTIVCDGRAVRDVDAGLTTGLTGLTLIGQEDFAFRVAPGAGTALSATFASVRWSAGYLALAGDITDGKIECRRGQKFHHVSGTAASLAIRCDASFAAASVVQTLRADGRWTVDALANATGFTLAVLRGGATLVSKRGGVLDVGASSKAELLDAAAIGTGTVVRGGGWLEDAASPDAAGTLEVEAGGVYNPMRARRAKTIPTLRLWPGHRAGRYTQAGEITVSTQVVYGLCENAQHIGGYQTGLHPGR